jgi:hypothetical protein
MGHLNHVRLIYLIEQTRITSQFKEFTDKIDQRMGTDEDAIAEDYQ